MPLIQLPVLGDRNPQAPHRLKRQIERFDRARLYAGKRSVRRDAFCLHQRACRPCLGRAFFGNVHVPPTREAVFEVPLRLSVTDEDEFGHAYFLICLTAP